MNELSIDRYIVKPTAFFLAGKELWVIEGTISWLQQYCRLPMRYERRADIHQAFLILGCALICWIALQTGH